MTEVIWCTLYLTEKYVLHKVIKYKKCIELISRNMILDLGCIWDGLIITFHEFLVLFITEPSKYTHF